MIDPLQEMMESAFATFGGVVGRSNRLEADAFLSKAELLEPRQVESEAVTDPTSFALKVAISGALTATITPGEVELGPATRLTWDGKRIINGTEDAASGCLTNHLTGETTITVTTGNTVWYVWANVNIVDGAETWEIFEGPAVTPLVESEDPSAEIKVIRQKIIAVLTIVDDVITAVDNKTCGNIDIPRL